VLVSKRDVSRKNNNLVQATKYFQLFPTCVGLTHPSVGAVLETFSGNGKQENGRYERVKCLKGSVLEHMRTCYFNGVNECEK
jgi:hypothetical protein